MTAFIGDLGRRIAATTGFYPDTLGLGGTRRYWGGHLGAVARGVLIVRPSRKSYFAAEVAIFRISFNITGLSEQNSAGGILFLSGIPPPLKVSG